MDKDGNKKEPTKKAIQDKEAKKDKRVPDYKEELAEELNLSSKRLSVQSKAKKRKKKSTSV